MEVGAGESGADDGTEAPDRGDRQGEHPGALAQARDVLPCGFHGRSEVGARDEHPARCTRRAARGSDQRGVIVLDGLVGSHAGTHHARVVLGDVARGLRDEREGRAVAVHARDQGRAGRLNPRGTGSDVDRTQGECRHADESRPD